MDVRIRLRRELNEGLPIDSRVGASPDVFSSTESRFKGTGSRSEPRVRFRYSYYIRPEGE